MATKKSSYLLGSVVVVELRTFHRLVADGTATRLRHEHRRKLFGRYPVATLKMLFGVTTSAHRSAAAALARRSFDVTTQRGTHPEAAAAAIDSIFLVYSKVPKGRQSWRPVLELKFSDQLSHRL